MQLALSTCWNAARHKDGFAMLGEIRDLGFSTVELGHNTRFSLWPGIQKGLREKVVGVRSLHNFCPVPLEVLRPAPNCYQFSDPSLEIRKQAIRATIESIRHAVELGAEAVVLHLGAAARRDELTVKLVDALRHGELYSRKNVRLKLKAILKRRAGFEKLWGRIRSCLDPIVTEASVQKIRLGVEFRAAFEEFPNPEEFEKVLSTYPESVIGFWHDFGHAGTMEELGWVDQIGFLKKYRHRLIGAHVQDFRPPVIDHLPLGKGILDFSSLLQQFPRDGIYVLELDSGATPGEIKESLKRWNSCVAKKG